MTHRHAPSPLIFKGETGKVGGEKTCLRAKPVESDFGPCWTEKLPGRVGGSGRPACARLGNRANHQVSKSFLAQEPHRTVLGKSLRDKVGGGKTTNISWGARFPKGRLSQVLPPSYLEF